LSFSLFGGFLPVNMDALTVNTLIDKLALLSKRGMGDNPVTDNHGFAFYQILVPGNDDTQDVILETHRGKLEGSI